MTRDFFDPPWEETNVVAIDRKTIETAMRQVESCESCNPEAQIPFDWVLDRVTGQSGPTTDYVLEVPGICRQCGSEITEKLWWISARMTLTLNSVLTCTTCGHWYVRDEEGPYGNCKRCYWGVPVNGDVVCPDEFVAVLMARELEALLLTTPSQ